MKVLPTQFRKHGFDHEVVRREEDIVLVRKTMGNWTGWEVAKVIHHNAYSLGGVEIEAGECMPSMEQWGTYAFSYTTEQDAVRRFEQMVIAQVMKA